MTPFIGKNDAAAAVRQRVELLAICHNPADRARLESIVEQPDWTVHWVPTISAAITFLKRNAVPVVLCCTEMVDGSWHDLLRLVSDLSEVPSVVVFTEDADESLWAEIMAGGAQDVLTKPFDADDFYEVVSLAFHAWAGRRQIPALSG